VEIVPRPFAHRSSDILYVPALAEMTLNNVL